MRFDTIEFFEALAAEMNAHPERFRPLGEAYMDCTVVMRDPRGDTGGDFVVRIGFDELRCTHVGSASDTGHRGDAADFALDGPRSAWDAMFTDIAANGHATGLHTLNSLALLGDDIRCVGDDPMGLDKFSRFNQTLQEFFDGAARVGVSV